MNKNTIVSPHESTSNGARRPERSGATPRFPGPRPGASHPDADARIDPREAFDGCEARQPEPVIAIQAEGRNAEIVIDTGRRLRSGVTWRVFAKASCDNVFAARLVAEDLTRRLGDAVEEARREAYAAGFSAGAEGRPPRTVFSREL